MVFSSPSGCIKVELTGVQQDGLTWVPRNAGRSSGSQLPERPAGVQAEEAPGEAGVRPLESRQRARSNSTLSQVAAQLAQRRLRGSLASL